MKIVDNCNSNNKSLSERHQVDMLVSLTNKVAALERENKELSALIATARYAFKGKHILNIRFSLLYIAVNNMSYSHFVRVKSFSLLIFSSHLSTFYSLSSR